MSQRKRLTLGITGGIATGKSSVLLLLKRSGIPVISSDVLAHACLQKNHPAYRRIVRHFGSAVLNAHRDIDRRRLGAIVFSDSKQRRWLERQIHPHVIRQLKSFIRKHKGLIALDIPLLFEAKLENLVDRVVVVSSSRAQQLARIKLRDHLPQAAALKRIHAQMALADKIGLADHVLENNQTPAELRKRVGELVSELKKVWA